MGKPIIAIVGRPNVGKSTFFNALIGERLAIVHDTPGITRDRLYAETTWLDRELVLVDTGGIEPHANDDLLLAMRQQAELAIDTADAILFMCDLKSGLTPADDEIAVMLRRSGKPIAVAVNKCDHPGDPPPEFYQFFQLGLGDVFPISSAHRLGLGELLDHLVELLPPPADETTDQAIISVAIIGKPNTGKSSLVNYILGEERAIVSPIAGTTRDALDVDFHHPTGHFRLIDTAGLRRQSKVDDRIEKYSIVRTVAAIERADVCLIMIDAAEGVTEQDTKVAGLAHNAGKASLFVVNKWDLIEKETGTLEAFREQVKGRFAFMPYAPVVFISALTGQRVHTLFKHIQRIYQEAGKRLSTNVINEVLAEALAMNPTPQDKGKRLKIYYATQVAVHPPQFVFFVNDQKLNHFSYERYLENQFRLNFGFEGTPIRLIWRDRRRDEWLTDQFTKRR